MEIGPEYLLEGLMLKLKLQYFGHLMRRTDSLKKTLILGNSEAGEGDDRGWDGWKALLTQWTWVWASSRSWWWTGKPGVLQSMGWQIVGCDWATELNWTGLSDPTNKSKEWRSWLHHQREALICQLIWHLIGEQVGKLMVCVTDSVQDLTAHMCHNCHKRKHPAGRNQSWITDAPLCFSISCPSRCLLAKLAEAFYFELGGVTSLSVHVDQEWKLWEKYSLSLHLTIC